MAVLMQNNKRINKDAKASGSSESMQHDHDKHIKISERHLGFIVAASALSCLLLFLCGYFLGRKDFAEQLLWGVEQRSFADRVCLALGQLQDSPELSEVARIEKIAKIEIGESQGLESGNLESLDTSDKNRYYAQLIGFNTKPAADALASRLRDRGLPVLIHKRMSKASRGVTRAWYQVVTDQFDNREKLEYLVDTIAKAEKLKGIRIVTV